MNRLNIKLLIVLTLVLIFNNGCSKTNPFRMCESNFDCASYDICYELHDEHKSTQCRYKEVWATVDRPTKVKQPEINQSKKKNAPAFTSTDADSAYLKQDYSKAYSIWLGLAQQGDVNSQFSLGLMYSDGIGVSQSYYQAAKWFRLAAKQGHFGAKYHLKAVEKKMINITDDKKTIPIVIENERIQKEPSKLNQRHKVNGIKKSKSHSMTNDPLNIR